MCKHWRVETVEQDEQPLFCVYYCYIHDEYFDGFNKPLELVERILNGNN